MPANNPGLSASANDLGLGDMLSQQVEGETEEARKKRMAEMEHRRMMGPAGSLAVTSLFGAGRAPGAGY